MHLVYGLGCSCSVCKFPLLHRQAAYLRQQVYTIDEPQIAAYCILWALAMYILGTNMPKLVCLCHYSSCSLGVSTSLLLMFPRCLYSHRWSPYMAGCRGSLAQIRHRTQVVKVQIAKVRPYRSVTAQRKSKILAKEGKRNGNATCWISCGRKQSWTRGCYHVHVSMAHVLSVTAHP